MSSVAGSSPAPASERRRRRGLVTDANRRWWTLGAVTFSLFMVMLDTTIVNVALPAIQLDLHIQLSRLEWAVNAFLLAYAALLLPGGKLADFVGRRRMLLIGLLVFTGSSLACGLATSGEMLIAARAAQGVGAALMMPATHALISANFEEHEHGLAYGVWAGVSTLGLALGPLVGGVLVQRLSWPWIFYVNVPLGAAAILLGRLVVRESRDTSTEQGLDPVGLVLSGGALFALVYALIEGHAYGWRSHIILGLLAASALGFALFVLLEALERRPMLDLSLFRNSTFTGANIVTALIMLTMLGVLFFVSIYLQNVLGFSPTQAGATFLPMTIILLLVSPIAGIAGDRLGFAWPVAAGMLMLAVALYLFSRLGVHATFWSMLPALIVGGIGLGVASAPVTAAAMTSTPLEKAGVGAGVLVSFRQTGGALGVAIMGAIVAAKLGSAVPGSPRFPQAFVKGFQDSLLVASGIAFAGAVVAAVTIKRVDHAPVFAASPEHPLAERIAVASVVGGIPAPTRIRTIVEIARKASAAGPVPVLVVAEGPAAGTRFEVAGERSLGREEADFSLDDPRVSRRHAVVRPVDDTAEVRDSGSANGTYVNGELLREPRRLADGDLVTLGDTVLRVELPAPSPALVVAEGPAAGTRFAVASELTIGRDEADISLDDPRVSRRHAIVRLVDETLEVRDAGSANGTHVNGERIREPRRLRAGDLIRLGDTVLRTELPEPAAALVVADGPEAGTRFPVAGELSLGRDEADITLDDPRVSRRHALVRPLDGALEVRDAGSANGTYVNGDLIREPRRLANGDLIRLGDTILRAEVPQPRRRAAPTVAAATVAGAGRVPPP
jgi:EmrB/QacA subfamily drug resistance transporter